MEPHLRVFLQPALVLLMRVQIVEDDVKLTIRVHGNEAVHERKKLNAAAPFGMRRDDPPGGDFESCEQGRGAVPLVVVALPGQSASVRQLQITLRPFQRLNRGFFIDTENNRLGGRINIKPDHIGGLRRELGIVALAPGFAGGKIDLVLAQKAPDILNINIAQCLGQQRTRPPRIALRRWLIQKRQNSLVRGLAVDPLLTGSWTILQPAKAVLGKPPPPLAHNTRLNAHFLGDRPRAATLSRQQHYSRSLDVGLRRTRRSAARLKHLAYLRLEPNLSCSRYHPDVES